VHFDNVLDTIARAEHPFKQYSNYIRCAYSCRIACCSKQLLCSKRPTLHTTLHQLHKPLAMVGVSTQLRLRAAAPASAVHSAVTATCECYCCQQRSGTLTLQLLLSLCTQAEARAEMISDLADMVAAKELIMFFETHPFSQLSNAFDKYYEPYKFRKVLLDMSI
jgi:hypothetical protein